MSNSLRDNKLRLASHYVDPSRTDSIHVKYDPMGNRVWKSATVDGVTTCRKYIVDISGKLPTIVCITDASDPNLLISSYIYAGAQVLSQRQYRDIADPNFEPADPNFYDAQFYVHDRLGSVRLVVDYNAIDATVSVANSYTYTPFGSFYDGEGPAETVNNPFKFTGQWHDAEINQYYLRARMYDPTMMRFTSRDPVRGKYEEPQTLHKYLYCINSPTKYIDPSGEISLPETLVNMAWTTSVGGFSGGLTGFFYSLGYMMANPERFENMTQEERDQWISDNVKNGIGLGIMAGITAGLGGTQSVVQFLYASSASAFPGGIAGGALMGFADKITDSLKGGGKNITRMHMRNAARNATLNIICDTWF